MGKKLLSKTHIKLGLQCRLALHKYFHKTDTPEFDNKGLLEKGQEVNYVLHSLFPDAIKVESDNNLEKLIQTQEALKTGKVIFEATFKNDEGISQADMLTPNGDGTWDLTEVKSSSSSKSSFAKKKKEYVDDATIQYHIMKDSIKIKNVYVWVVNKEYVYDGKEYTLELFHKVNITEEVINNEEKIAGIIKNSRIVVEDIEPSVKIGSQCTAPHDCPFKHTCWKAINETDLVKIPSLRGKQKLFNEGITSASHDYFDSKGNKMAVEALRENKRVVINKKLKEYMDFISQHKTVHYLDFEGLNHPLPLWEGTSPYEQIPFQYSIHVKKNKEIFHKECLAEGKENPSKEIAQRLAKDIKDAEILLVYYETYEKGVLRYLAEKHPEYASIFLEAIDKIFDLYKVVKDTIFDPNFEGSYSLKKVSPALLGEKASWDGELDNGAQAADIYVQAINSFDEDKKRIFNELIIYCTQDTMNLVYLHEFLEELVA